MRIPEIVKKNLWLINNASHLDFNDNSTLHVKGLDNNTYIAVDERNLIIAVIAYKGKEIEAKIYNKEKLISNFKIWILNTIEHLYETLEYYIPSEYSKIKKIRDRRNGIKKDDKRTFSSIGINNDFICNIE